jgi:hypothetical protein
MRIPSHLSILRRLTVLAEKNGNRIKPDELLVGTARSRRSLSVTDRMKDEKADRRYRSASAGCRGCRD